MEMSMARMSAFRIAFLIWLSMMLPLVIYLALTASIDFQSPCEPLNIGNKGCETSD